jgi:hypothetical protein
MKTNTLSLSLKHLVSKVLIVFVGYGFAHDQHAVLTHYLQVGRYYIS